MRVFLFALGWFCLSGAVRGQNLHGLLQQEGLSPGDTASVSRLVELGQAREADEPSISAIYYKAAGQLSDSLGYVKGTLRFISNYTYLLNMQGKYDSSLVLNNKAIDLARLLNDSLALAKSLFNTGTSLQLLGRYEAAVDRYLEGRRIFEFLGYDQFRVIGADVLQTLYQKLHRYTEAISYGEQAIEASRAAGMEHQLGMALCNMSDNYLHLDQPGKALELLDEALPISRRQKDKYLEETIHINYARSLEALNRFAEMERHTLQAYQLASEISDWPGIGHCLLLFSAHSLYTGQASHARAKAEEALKVFDENNLQSEKVAALRWLGEVSLVQGDFEAFQRYRQEESVLLNTLLDTQIQERILGLEQQYESELKVQRIALLEANQQRQARMLSNRRNWMMALAAILVLLTIVVILVWRNLRHKLQLRQKALSRIALESQLRASESLLKGEEMERERVARDLHDSLGALLSGIKFSFQNMKENIEIPRKNEAAYNKGLAMLDASVDEVRRIAHNMMPASLLKFGLDSALRDLCDQLNRGGDMEFSYQSVGLQEGSLEQSRMLSLYRIVQELMSNAVRHSGAKHVIVQLIQADNSLTLTVEDDGRGLDQNPGKTGNGMGWENIRNRARLLQGALEVLSSPGKGTTVELRMPL